MTAYPVLAFKMAQMDITSNEIEAELGVHKGYFSNKFVGRRPFSDYEKIKIKKLLGCEKMDDSVLFADRQASKKLEQTIGIMAYAMMGKLKERMGQDVGRT